MKSLMTILTLFLTMTTVAQEQNFQFGKPDKEQLSMMSYEKDTTAPAVILNEKFNLFYSINTRGEIRQHYSIARRIKVLKKEGTSYGDIEFTLYNLSNTNDETSYLEKLEAFSFNIEGGKTLKNEVKKQLIFREKVSDKKTVVKFTVPDVKVGSIIEYRYSIRSAYTMDIPSHEFQHNIPTLNSTAEYIIPEYFRFNVTVAGYHHVDVQRKEASKTVNIAGMPLTYTENIVTGNAKEIPALKDEPYVWNYKEYISRLSLELDEYTFPGQITQRISSDWGSVNQTLKESRFGSNLKMGNPLKKEMENLYSNDVSEEEKIQKILSLLKSKIKWNNILALTAESPRNALNNGEGNSADINFILMAMLNDAGFNVTPMLLNPRYLDRIRHRATLDNINYFILQVKLSDGTVCYLDGTNEYSDINILPEYLLTDRAHLYGDNTNKFHDLTALTRNSTRKTIMAEFDSTGVMKMQIRTHYNNMDAYITNNKLAKYNNEDEFADALEKKLQTSVTNIKLERSNTRVTESYDLEYTPVSSGDFIYLNAIMFPDFTSNPFKSIERKLPIEFSHPQISRIDYLIKIPDGYTVAEMPKSTALSACNGGLDIKFIATQKNGTIQISYTANTSRIIYPSEEYANISTFFAKMVELAKQQIVLKRQPQQQ